jgi:deoxyribodipyrimidine photo-lyase
MTIMKPTSNMWKIPLAADERDQSIQALFPNAQRPPHKLLQSLRGGRQQALSTLSKVDGVRYGQTRNYLNGHVTHLSPYLRHGCITIKEAVTHVNEQFGISGQKLLNEFAWREYWRTVWYYYGNAILLDMQPPKVTLSFNSLPDDIKQASTGLPCMDSFITTLNTEGYLHNHARMWLASYVVHWRKTDWLNGANWMHDLLLDGDYASNHLSWQWVASTFSHKPYFFNQENLAKYTNHQHCETCRAACPFKDSYENLDQQLFKPTQQAARQQKPAFPIIKDKPLGNQTIVWVHDEMLSNKHPLLTQPYEKIFIIDPDFYQNWSIIRLQFIADCLIEMPDVKVWIGNASEAFSLLNTQQIMTQNTPNIKLKQQATGYPVMWHPEQKVCSANLTATDIKSFSRFWKTASKDFICQ